MPSKSSFRFRNPLLLMALAAAFPLASHAAGAASIDFAAGAVTAVNVSGVQRPLMRGAEIGNGDTIRTGKGGRAQVRFSDGGMISLQPDTEFRVDEYRYSGKTDGEEKGFFSLLKGGLRTITGFVGRVNRNNYKITTSVATIGIRGTEFSAAVNNDLLHVSTGEGLVEVCNAVGCMLLASGESGVIQGGGEPRRTDNRPLLPPAPLESGLLPVFSVAEDRNPDGSPAILSSNAVTVGGIVGASGGVFRDSATLTLNGDGSLASFTSGGLTSSQGTALMADYNGSDPVLKWGAWKDGSITIDNSPVPLSPNQAMHFFWGSPMVTMPVSGTATYTFMGGTSPTEAMGSQPPGTLSSATLSVDFGAQSFSTSVNGSISGGSTLFSGSGSGTISGSGFSGALSGNVGGCGASGSVDGKFFGTTAERAGMSYLLDAGMGGKVIGVAAFKK